MSSYNRCRSGDALQFLLGTGESDAIQNCRNRRFGAVPKPGDSDHFDLALARTVSRGARTNCDGLLSKTDRVGQSCSPGGRQIKPAELSPTQVDFLLDYREPGISQRARRIFGPISRARPAVVEHSTFARTAGVAARDVTFSLACAECHRLSREGSRLGPDLAGAKILGKEKLLSAILEPN